MARLPVLTFYRARATSQRNRLFIATDGLRLNLGGHGDLVAQTPVLDKLASEEVQHPFRHAKPPRHAAATLQG